MPAPQATHPDWLAETLLERLLFFADVRLRAATAAVRALRDFVVALEAGECTPEQEANAMFDLAARRRVPQPGPTGFVGLDPRARRGNPRDELAHARMLLELHELIAGGQGEGQAADALRERLDETHVRLSRAEQNRERRLAIALNQHTFPERMPSP